MTHLHSHNLCWNTAQRDDTSFQNLCERKTIFANFTPKTRFTSFNDPNLSPSLLLFITANSWKSQGDKAQKFETKAGQSLTVHRASLDRCVVMLEEDISSGFRRTIHTNRYAQPRKPRYGMLLNSNAQAVQNLNISLVQDWCIPRKSDRKGRRRRQPLLFFHTPEEEIPLTSILSPASLIRSNS